MSLQDWLATGVGLAALVLAVPILRVIETHDYHRDAEYVSPEAMRRLGLR